jgi:hypothetical protein
VAAEETAVSIVVVVFSCQIQTPLNRVLPENLIFAQLVKKCLAFYRTQRFIIMFKIIFMLNLFNVFDCHVEYINKFCMSKIFIVVPQILTNIKWICSDGIKKLCPA